MVSIRLSQDLSSRLENLSKLTHRAKSFYVKEALNKYMDDMEDIYESIERIVDQDKKLLSSDEFLKNLK